MCFGKGACKFSLSELDNGAFVSEMAHAFIFDRNGVKHSLVLIVTHALESKLHIFELADSPHMAAHHIQTITVSERSIKSLHASERRVFVNLDNQFIVGLDSAQLISERGTKAVTLSEVGGCFFQVGERDAILDVKEMPQ